MTDAGPTALTRIAVVDDHPVFREGTAALLAREPDFDVVALGASPEDALAIASAADAPDVLLLDVRLGDDSGLRVLESLARRTAVVIVTAYDASRTAIAQVTTVHRNASWLMQSATHCN